MVWTTWPGVDLLPYDKIENWPQNLSKHKWSQIRRDVVRSVISPLEFTVCQPSNFWLKQLRLLPDFLLVGQNLAREMGELDNPESRVERWYLESKKYTYSKYESPMRAAVCSSEPCGHYTQVSLGEARRVGTNRQGTRSQVSSFFTRCTTSARSVNSAIIRKDVPGFRAAGII